MIFQFGVEILSEAWNSFHETHRVLIAMLIIVTVEKLFASQIPTILEFTPCFLIKTILVFEVMQSTVLVLFSLYVLDYFWFLLPAACQIFSFASYLIVKSFKLNPFVSTSCISSCILLIPCSDSLTLNWYYAGSFLVIRS